MDLAGTGGSHDEFELLDLVDKHEITRDLRGSHPWGPGTLGSSAPRNPHPKSPCVGEERRAWSGSNPLDWISNRGLQA